MKLLNNNFLHKSNKIVSKNLLRQKKNNAFLNNIKKKII